MESSLLGASLSPPPPAMKAGTAAPKRALCLNLPLLPLLAPASRGLWSGRRLVSSAITEAGGGELVRNVQEVRPHPLELLRASLWSP